YTRPFLHDYTPGYLYVLWALGSLAHSFDPAAGLGDLIKVPAILSDLVLGWFVWSMARELGAGRRAALIGGALVVANPVSWFDSVLWGQVDSFGVIFLLLGLRALWRDRPERAAIFTVIAALTKPQLAILVPIVAVVTIRRAFARRRVDGTNPAADPAPDAARAPGATTSELWPVIALERFRAWERQTNRPIRVVTTAIAAFLTAVVMCVPFGLSVIGPPTQPGSLFDSGLVDQIFKTAAGYPYASVNAYNPWALATAGGTGVAATGGWACDTVILGATGNNPSCPQAVMIAGIPAVYVGAALLIAAFIVVCVVVAARPTPLTMLVGVTVLTVAFFVLPTRVHERYLYPFIAVGAVLAAVSIRWRLAYVVLSATTFLNMYVVLTTLYSNNPGVSDWLGIGGDIRKTEWVTAIVVALTVAAVWVALQLRGGAERRLAREIEHSRADDLAELEDAADEEPSGPAFAGSSARVAAAPGVLLASDAGRSGLVGGGPRVAATAAGGAAGAVALPTWSEPPSLSMLGPIGWVRAKLDERPVRADRSATLASEPHGRLDRLDLWILVVLVAAILGVRMFRLSEPYQMHFDEVYHARTATEFLQDWRYGEPHQIYEYTHPHVAKYAMAGGLVAWGDDRVTATSQLGTPVVDAAIEPRADDPAISGGRSGDRVDIVTGGEVRSLDLTTRKLVARIPISGASAVAADPTGQRLFVGSTDGSISTVDTGALDQLRNGGATVAPQALGFGQVDGQIRRLFVAPDGQAVVALTADDRAITIDTATAAVRATVQLKAAGDIAAAGTAPALVATPDAVKDRAAAAKALASIFGGGAATFEKALAATADRTVLAPITNADQRTKVQTGLDTGPLAGLTIDSVPQIAVADARGVELIDEGTGTLSRTVDVGAPAHGLALTTMNSGTLYVATDPDKASATPGRIAIVAVGGDPAKNGAAYQTAMAMPGAVTRVAWDDATEMVHVLGTTPDGSASTVYVIEPHGNAVYADARLPF
ncbi:MAG TPA: hypothetical protein VFP22_03055, partial [Candidatus Limnocylindrales bacterium]|nr:hypothetical protein [Candidatus Limnocylindrales bacterium]